MPVLQSTDVLDVVTDTVGHLQTLPLEALSPAELEALVDHTTTLARRLDSVRLAAVGELAERAVQEGRPAREVRDLVQRTSQAGAGAARRTVETAQALARLPETASALADGTIGTGKAELVVRTATTLAGDTLAGDALAGEDPEDPSMVEALADVDRLGAGLGPLTSPYKLREALEDTAHRHQPTTLAERDAGAVRNRTYTGWVDRDGMYNGAFRVPKLQGEAIETLIDSLSKPHSAQDDRTPGQRRADALVDVCTTMLPHGAPESGGYRPQIVAVADNRHPLRHPRCPGRHAGPHRHHLHPHPPSPRL